MVSPIVSWQHVQILFTNILPLFIYFLLLRHFEMQFYASFLQLKGETLGLGISSI